MLILIKKMEERKKRNKGGKPPL